MRTQMPTVIRFWANKMGAIPIDVCHGPIPDIFRTSMFGPTTELELPDAKESDDEFEGWLSDYRSSWCRFESRGILDFSLTKGRVKCN